MLLAFDTATAATVVGLGTLAGEMLAGARHDPAPGERPGHGRALLTLCEQVLGEGGVDWGELTRIGTGVGPGGFTGLRIGLATAGGLASSLGAQTVAVSSLEALASGTDADVLAVIDARRGEVFARDRGAECVCAPQDLDVAGRTVVGDGAIRYRDLFTAGGGVVPGGDDGRHLLGARSLVALAAGGAPGLLAPAYLRAPDAVPRSGR